MADKRINALTTTSASVGDDYFAIDGATNGTRALSAFSPTFGGNATVTGTLTSQSTLSTAAGLICQNADITGGYIILRGYSDQNGGLIFLGQSSNNNFIQSNATTIGVTIAGTGVTQTVAAGFRVLATTASTTTSSGALVVSGGVGVAGAIYAGGTQGIVNNVSGSNDALLSVKGASQEWQFRLIGATGNLAIYNSTSASSPVLISPSTGNAIFGSGVSVTTTLSVNGTTASTSTSSGALVVSGGVGVAGAIVTGGIVRCGGTNGLSLGSDTGNIRIDSAGPAGVEFRGLSAADTISGFTMREMALIDGTTAPSTRAGYATIYVDSADGDLKVKFGDGTVKTIATDS